MSYTSKDIRNVALLGHGGDGKSALAESMLFLTKAVDRLGKATDGTTASDFDSEEIKRQISISASVLPVEYKKVKINVIDNPGYFDFEGEIMQSLRVVDSGVILCTAKGGIEVGTEKAWKYLSSRGLPRFVYVSKLDEENADFDATYESLRDKFGMSVVPVVVPVVEGGKAVGVANIVSKKAYIDGKETAIPDSMADTVESYLEQLTEAVAETDEELMMKYFEGEAFTDAEYVNGLKNGVKSGSICPVFCGCAISGLGTEALMQGLIDYAPNPLEGLPQKGEDANGEAVEWACDASAPATLFFFKTVSDQYGKQSFFRVVSGSINSDSVLVNARTGDSEKLAHIYMIRGKKTTEVKDMATGDIGVVSKMASVKTGDTLCTAGSVVTLEPISYAIPCYSMAISPKTKGQEDKIAAGLTKMNEEDPSFSVYNNPETKQMVLSGAGDIQLDILCSRLKSKFNVETELSPAKVAYREKIRKKVQVRGRHKKQSGGHGQFGDVVIEFEPGDVEDLVFEEKIFGGSVPKNFFPAVEKGLRESISKGVLAGYPVVFLKATLVDGSYHPVDSSEMAFKTAAQLAYKDGLPQASPVLLEPIGALKVTIPDSYMGDIMSDISKRNGRVLGMNPDNEGNQIVEAEVPMAEMSSYAIDLRSMTQGRGSFTLNFERYEEANATVQAKVIAEAKAAEAE
ncbi:MAG: elongation factor G [Ruminococcaceae bacterium]|nr:elongation factor G [Oscillospiraceae bacterium]